MDDYIKQATRTESVDLFKVDSPRILHAAIGAMTEISELLLVEENDANHIKEEMGDICWYVAIACDALGVTFDGLLSLADTEKVEDDPIKALLFGASNALDVVKRALFYGVEFDEAAFGQQFGNLLASLKILAEDDGWKLSDLQEANIRKLTRRYPEKFTSEQAVNRDTEAELEAVGV